MWPPSPTTLQAFSPSPLEGHTHSCLRVVLVLFLLPGMFLYKPGHSSALRALLKDSFPSLPFLK